MMDLTEKQIIERAWFLIRDSECGGTTHSEKW